MIAETASTESGGDKAAWITSAYLDEIPRQFPRLRAVVWFNHHKETSWPVDSSPASLAAYSEVASSPLDQRGTGSLITGS
jgi:endoglucanase